MPDATFPTSHELPRWRINLLRAAYLLLLVGLGKLIVPEILSHPLNSRGVIASLLGAIWLLAFIGIRYPLKMLPLLLFEFTWKTIWVLAYALPQWSSRELPPTFGEDVLNIGVGVIVMTLVIPWRYVFRHYIAYGGTRADPLVEAER